MAVTDIHGIAATVSCIVPAYNADRFIAETLDSILAQTHAPHEVLVVDDGSTDQTAEIVSRYKGTVQFIEQANAGPAAARNHGVRVTSGNFIAFLDSDDLWKPDKIERQLQRFSERPELEISFTDLLNFRATTADGAFRDGWSEDRSWPRVPLSPCTLLAKRSAVERVGEFDVSLRRGEDTEWFVRMMLKKVAYEVLPEEMLWRRIHDRNLTAEEPPSPLAVVKMLKVVLDRRRAEGW